jgi:Tol biopolymer transport system component/DNA-binding winged helix-turn-helix (wHTH) protein
MLEDFYIDNHWLVQPSLNRISNGRKSVRIPAKYMQVLVSLAERPGEAVSREHLMETVWKDTIVVEESLTRAISELRKIFDDDPKRTQIIETIPKIGYRLIVPVQRNAKLLETKNVNLSLPNREASKEQTAQSTSSHKRIVRTPFLFAGVILLSALAFVIWNFSDRSGRITASPILRTTPLTSYQGFERQPALSPDGKKLAFVWTGGTGQVDGIYIKEIGSDLSTRLTGDATNANEPAWSPDGRALAYVGHSLEGCKIFKVPTSGGLSQAIVEVEKGAHPFEPAWSPDGNWLAYTVERLSQSSLYLLSLETLVNEPLETAKPEEAQDRKPVFSPDGKKIAFLRTVQGKTSIQVISLKGGEAVQLSMEQQTINDLDWMPDGRAVVFASNEGIWKLPVSGGKAELLAALGATVDRLAVAREARRMAYEQSSEESNIWQISLAQSEPRATQLIGSSRADAYPAISPDGKWIAFVSDRTGSPQIWKSDWTGSNAVALTNWNEVKMRKPCWSPDGRLIAFAANPEGQFDIFVVSSKGGEPQRLTTTLTNENTPTWSKDGRWIYFNVAENGCWRIDKISTSDHSIVPAVSQNSTQAQESSDGQWLYFTLSRRDTSEFWRQPREGGASEMILRVQGMIGDDWKLRDEGIYFSRLDARCRPSFGFFSFKTRQVSTLFSSAYLSFNFDVAPDGRTLIFDQFDRSESDIMMLENF